MYYVSSLQRSKDLVQEVATLHCSLDDADEVSGDAEKVLAFNRCQNIALEELNVCGINHFSYMDLLGFRMLCFLFIDIHYYLCCITRSFSCVVLVHSATP